MDVILCKAEAVSRYLSVVQSPHIHLSRTVEFRSGKCDQVDPKPLSHPDGSQGRASAIHCLSLHHKEEIICATCISHM